MSSHGETCLSQVDRLSGLRDLEAEKATLSSDTAKSRSSRYVSAALPWGGSLRFFPPGGSAAPSGRRVWASSVALCGALRERQGQIHGGRALELGAGAGLPGLLAASLGCAQVTFTDSDEAVVQALRGNVARVPPDIACQFSVERLDFANASEVASFSQRSGIAGFLELVFAADCAYSPGAAVALVEAVFTFLTPSGVALLADKDRPIGDRTPIRQQLRSEAERRGFFVHDVDPCDCFLKGLDAIGLEPGLVTGCVDERSFLLILTRTCSTVEPLAVDSARLHRTTLVFDEMD